MGISKDWLKNLLDESILKAKQFEENKDYDRGNIELGKIQAFEITYKKLIESPTKKIKKSSFDADKAYGEIVKHYVDKKRYSVERANEIAKKVVSSQQERLT